jgi:hypothetical protein
MQITRNNIFTGMPVTRDMKVTSEQIANWKNGMLIKDAMPNITSSEREFFVSGVSDEDWEKLFKNA